MLKIFVSDYTYRTEAEQLEKLYEDPRLIDAPVFRPADLPTMFRETQREVRDTYCASSLACFGKTPDGLVEFLENCRKRKTRIVGAEEKYEWHPGQSNAGALKAWRLARVKGAAKAGAGISADNRKARSAEGAARIKDRWSMDSKTWPTKVLLKEADISYNTAKTLLPPRPVAQYNYKAKHGKQIKQVELSAEPREKTDFCGVYIFHIEEGVYKVGSSCHSGRRFKEVSQHHKKQMRVVETFNMDINKAIAVEAEAHHLLRKHLAREYNGREIFQASLNTIRKSINRAIKNVSRAPKYE